MQIAVLEGQLRLNCPKHITPRFTVAEVEAAVAALKARIAELEARLVSSCRIHHRTLLLDSAAAP